MNNNLEIEKKYLIKKIPFDLKKYQNYRITQGYLSFENQELRIRKANNKYYLTSKYGNGLIRKEIEKEITEDVFDILKKFVISKYIEKTRYLINLNDEMVAELDVYHESLKGLKVVEVEFKSLEEANSFEKPNWFGEEITDDNNYRNSFLARDR